VDVKRERPGNNGTVGVLVGASLMVASLFVARPGPSTAQVIRGRVLDESNDRSVPTALVRLLDHAGDERAITAADSSGGYRLSAPEPGVYRVVAERLGYEPFETPLLEMRDPEGSYPLDLLMRRAPIPIRGLEVSTDRMERAIRLVIGVSLASLRVDPLSRSEIVEHVERAHAVTDVVRWGNLPGIVVRESTEGPCFQVRNRGCLNVYLNGFSIVPTLVDVIPLEMVHSFLVLYPGETIAYPSGAVLLYTAAWLR
jgi:hypothetical protein